MWCRQLCAYADRSMLYFTSQHWTSQCFVFVVVKKNRVNKIGKTKEQEKTREDKYCAVAHSWCLLTLSIFAVNFSLVFILVSFLHHNESGAALYFPLQCRNYSSSHSYGLPWEPKSSLSFAIEILKPIKKRNYAYASIKIGEERKGKLMKERKGKKRWRRVRKVNIREEREG